MTIWRKVALTAAGLALIAGPVRAQGGDGLDVRLNPRIGLYGSLTSLTEIEEAGQTAAAELGGSLAVGLSVQVDLGLMPIGLRANLDYATGSKIFWEEGGFRTEQGEATVLAAAADVLVRVLPRSYIISPYLFAGGGLKQYDFTLSQESSIEEFRDESDPAFHFGAGVDLGLGPLALNVEVGDYVSWYEPDPVVEARPQHDVFATLGLSIGLI
jgi:hypothetical protein